MRAAWECAGAVKWFDDTRALDGAGFALPYTKVIALLGHNGAGKSTLFRAATGLVELDEGEMRVAGHASGSRQAQEQVSFLPEQPDLYSGVSVSEHVSFIALAHRLTDSEPRAQALLDRFGLSDRLDALPHELSQGLRQRLGLVMALLHGASVLLLDEPFNGLDPRSAAELRSMVRDLAASGACVVVATHIIGEVARLADRILVLERGRVVAQGSIDELREQAGLGPDAGLEEAYLALTDAPEEASAGER